VAGLASIVFGVLMIVLPVAGVIALTWLIAAYALSFGVLMLALSLRLRRVQRGPVHAKRPVGIPTIQPA
jgi:uncharacterized membrane protein HdeD (DUF308 family)